MLPGTLSQVVSVAEQTTSLCCLLVSQASRWRVAPRVTPSHPICRDPHVLCLGTSQHSTCILSEAMQLCLLKARRSVSEQVGFSPPCNLVFLSSPKNEASLLQPGRLVSKVFFSPW